MIIYIYIYDLYIYIYGSIDFHCDLRGKAGGEKPSRCLEQIIKIMLPYTRMTWSPGRVAICSIF